LYSIILYYNTKMSRQCDKIENMFELNVDIAEYYCSTLQQIVVELEDDFDCGALEGMTNPDIDDIRRAVMDVAFNEKEYYGNHSPVVEGQFGLDYQVINELFEYECNLYGNDVEWLFPMSRENIFNKYAYHYSSEHMMGDIPFDSLSKKILMLESLILSIYEENENKKTIKNFAERISIKSIINTKFGVGLVSDLIFTHYDTE